METKTTKLLKAHVSTVAAVCEHERGDRPVQLHSDGRLWRDKQRDGDDQLRQHAAVRPEPACEHYRWHGHTEFHRHPPAAATACRAPQTWSVGHPSGQPTRRPVACSISLTPVRRRPAPSIGSSSIREEARQDVDGHIPRTRDRQFLISDVGSL